MNDHIGDRHRAERTHHITTEQTDGIIRSKMWQTSGETNGLPG